MKKSTLSCLTCNGGTRVVAYRATIKEDPNENFVRIPDLAYCPPCKKFYKVSMEEIQIG